VAPIIQLLVAMGDSAEAVAETLQREGIHGRQENFSFENPIVRYLNRHLNIGHRLEVESGGSVLRAVRGGQVQDAALSAAVRAFLERFDQGLYPELESP
jgi:hypothetical protein